MLKQTHLVVYFVFLSTSSQTLLSQDIASFVVDPSSLGLYSPPWGASPLAAWGEERGRRGDRSSSEGRSLPSHRHLIQSRHHWPSNAKGAGERSWTDRQKFPTSLKSCIYFHSDSFQNKLFQRTSHQG
ncbi:hypothetical protein GOODEAATRI_000890 [Goodea atripinnis]|uniref:Secreted protein n=1 Tax=Goodea atripinnis TaxID=208336 RepID=A0ABV0P0C4_9TELE